MHRFAVLVGDVCRRETTVRLMIVMQRHRDLMQVVAACHAASLVGTIESGQQQPMDTAGKHDQTKNAQRPQGIGLVNVDRQPHHQPENHDTPAPNTASDEPSTTNSKSRVRRANWNLGLGGGMPGWGTGSLMSCRSSPRVIARPCYAARRRRVRPISTATPAPASSKARLLGSGTYATRKPTLTS